MCLALSHRALVDDASHLPVSYTIMPIVRFGKGLKSKSHRDDLPEQYKHLGRTVGVRSAEWWAKK